MDAFITSLALLLLFAGLTRCCPWIWRAMRRRGLRPEDAAGKDAKLARAVRRCVMCPSIDDCDQWLASGDREGLGLFCPNATFLSDIEREKGPGNTR